MGGFNDLFQSFPSYMRVDLGRRYIGMTEQRLNASEVGTALDQMGGKGMAHDMGRQPLWIDTRPDSKLLQQLMTPAAGQMTRSAMRGEQVMRGPSLPAR